MSRLNAGFTLLELMVGIVILGILATLATPSFSKAIEKMKVKDAQSTLAAIYSAEKIYRLDQTSYGTLAQLVGNNYISDPDPSDSNTTWDFAAGGGTGGIATTFAAGVIRTQAGGRYNNNTIAVDQNFSGEPNTSPGYGGRTYLGNHELRD